MLTYCLVIVYFHYKCAHDICCPCGASAVVGIFGMINFLLFVVKWCLSHRCCIQGLFFNVAVHLFDICFI